MASRFVPAVEQDGVLRLRSHPSGGVVLCFSEHGSTKESDLFYLSVSDLETLIFEAHEFLR